VQALADGHLAGAALDVFDPEPIGPGHPLLEFDNVIVTPHAIAYTTAAFEGLGRTAIDAVLAVHSGEVPAHVANPAALANDAPRATR
jgi:D-3-phosphoglycerate dehydrogenase / 2-oxoglutarate reductase